MTDREKVLWQLFDSASAQSKFSEAQAILDLVTRLREVESRNS